MQPRNLQHGQQGQVARSRQSRKIPKLNTRDTSLSRKAMLVSLKIGVWSASKFDKNVSDEVAQEKNASEDAGRYRKHLLPQFAKDGSSLAKVKQAATAAREFHYDNTLPWSQDGSRILTKANYFQYVEKMRKFRIDFDTAVSVFMDEYPKAAEEARHFLGDMYRGGDYPNPAAMASNFKFDNIFLPFPDAQDFRVDITEDEVNEIKKTLKAKSAEAVTGAMRDAWNRLYEAVSHAAEKLSNPDDIFRDSLIGNLTELCNVLPRLNITEDQYLDQMCTEVRSKLTAHTPKELRKDPALRNNVATDAAGIVNMMQSYMGDQK